MNKRKPDDEFARIDLSYIDANGKDVVVYCPESQNATATLEPARRTLEPLTKVDIEPPVQQPDPAASPATPTSAPEKIALAVAPSYILTGTTPSRRRAGPLPPSSSRFRKRRARIDGWAAA
jgi:ATP-dependent Lon protease